MRDLDALLNEMTLEEKVSLLSGASFWYTPPVERLGIPAIKVTDGPNGARGDGLFDTGIPAACFPVGIALAATWNTDLIREIGVALGQEAKTKGAHVLLAPTVNIHRTPINGRNFECYSEDPYLTGEIAAAYIQGVQSEGVAATVKHFIGNESEYQRMTMSSEIGERALREIYLPPFKAAVKKGQTWALMSSYNYINGVHASANPYTLTSILRDEWGYEGIVMSDWFATRHTAESVAAGQDLEMPGPTMWRGDKLVDAVNEGKIEEAVIDTRVKAMLRLIERVGAFDTPATETETSVINPQHSALIRRAGAEGAVLLKNTGVLPLSPDKIGTIAIIGPNAKSAAIMGGGSAQLNPHYSVAPYDGIAARASSQFEMRYAMGCANHKTLPLLNTATFGGLLTADFYNSPDLSGELVGSIPLTSTRLMGLGLGLPAGVNPYEHSARIHGTLHAPHSGKTVFSLSVSGKAKLFIDGTLVVDNWTTPAPGHFILEFGHGEAFGEFDLTKGQTYEYVIEYTTQDGDMLRGVRGGMFKPLGAQAIEEAVALAAESEAAVVIVGLNGEWESEGYDRTTIDLPAEQNELITRVAAVNPNTVVVVQTGSPISMPWLDQVAAVLQAWYAGQETGNAISDVLFGDVAPSGKLPQTFPLRLEDNPAYINYPGENGKVVYGEGIFVGYRYYEKKQVTPLFPFGFGLTYTTFAYSNLRLSADTHDANQPLSVTFDLTNTGSRAGQEIAQVYVRDVAAPVARPEKELKGFVKVTLEPGETRSVSVTLDRESFAYYDDAKRTWVADAGEFVIAVGGASNATPLHTSVTLSSTVEFTA